MQKTVVHVGPKTRQQTSQQTSQQTGWSYNPSIMAAQLVSKPNKDQHQFIEPDTHSFVVKLWLDPPEGEPEDTRWQGEITHVASGQRYRFGRLRELDHFLRPFLDTLGIKRPFFWRIVLWMSQ